MVPPMTSQDLDRILLSSSPARLNALAAQYGLRQVKAVWWFRKSVTDPVSRAERQITRSTKRGDLRDALRVAVPIVDQWLALEQTDRAAPLGAKLEWATVGAVVEFYLKWPHGDHKTRERCAREMATLVTECWPSVKWDQVSTEALTSDSRLKWRQAREMASAAKHLPSDAKGRPVGPQNAEAHERTKRNLNQMLANTSSVFSRPAREAYRIGGLRVHDAILGWLDVCKVKAKKAAMPEPLTDAVLATIAAELPALRERDPATWAAVTLMFYAGIRNSEAVEARWSWLGGVDRDDDGTEIRGLRLESAGEHLSKGSDGMVPVLASVWEDLATVRHLGEAGQDYIMPGVNASERHHAAYRAASVFLVSCGVEKRRGKTTYRLRGKSISLMGGLHGDAAAARLARHVNEKTTRENYTGTRTGYHAMPAMAGGQNAATKGVL